MQIKEYAKTVLRRLLEDISLRSEGCCALCSGLDFPVNGEKSGYENIAAEDAEEWQIEHFPDCPVLDIEKALSAIK